MRFFKTKPELIQFRSKSEAFGLSIMRKERRKWIRQKSKSPDRWKIFELTQSNINDYELDR